MFWLCAPVSQPSPLPWRCRVRRLAPFSFEDLARSEHIRNFQASAGKKQLLSLLTNTFYSNELIFNASDALGKFRYDSIADPDKTVAQPNFYFRIIPNKTNLTKNVLVNNLGTIASLGTKAFMEAPSAGGVISLIGQFGVGFFSAYLSSDKFRVVCKNNDDEQYVWESAFGGSFTGQKDTEPMHDEVKRSTQILCYLKKDPSEVLEERRPNVLVQQFLKFIGFPE